MPPVGGMALTAPIRASRVFVRRPSPRPTHPRFTFTHKYITTTPTATLKTDASGCVNLGALVDVVSFTVSGIPGGLMRNFTLPSPVLGYSSSITATVGETTQAIVPLSLACVLPEGGVTPALATLRDAGKCRTSYAQCLTLAASRRELVVSGLPEGRYKLVVKSPMLEEVGCSSGDALCARCLLCVMRMVSLLVRGVLLCCCAVWFSLVHRSI